MLQQPAKTQPCPCQSGKVFAKCCEPCLEGLRPAATAEQLMRSRYSAFALGLVRYIFETTHPSQRADFDIGQLQQQLAATTWVGLTITSRKAGSRSDSRGEVSFEAKFEDEQGSGVLSERSQFVKQQGRWFYVDGDVEVTEHPRD